MRNDFRRRWISCRVIGEQPLRQTFRAAPMLVAALLLVGCDQPAQKASSNRGAAAVKNAVGAAERQPADQTVRIVINPQFDEADAFSEGPVAVRVGAKYGYIDKQGKIAIKPQFDFAGAFSEGLAGVGLGSHVGYIDQQGKIV